MPCLQDPFLSYTGTAPYLRKSYAASYVQSPKVVSPVFWTAPYYRPR